MATIQHGIGLNNLELEVFGQQSVFG